MPLSRNARTDRRRRVMREAVAADAEVAVESVRAKQRRRLKAHSEDEDGDDYLQGKRDPGYSHAVRKACQQRVVQLIPVRRMSLSLALLVAWGGWLALMSAHYFIHVRNLSVAVTGANAAGQVVGQVAGQSAGQAQLLPIAYLFHLRSTHGIAHWLGGQLWLLTAIAAFLIFQLRRHKLDDYRAKYRLWAMVAIAALFSSMDASTSGLYLFGRSIDGWALRETGYSGWSIVLATFATLIGLLGIRLCNEFKSTPLSLLFWLGGLLSWATSALLGTGLLKLEWSQQTLDMVVGGSWLGGILSVFLATGIYLRQIYIDAQRRFITRNRLLSANTPWRMPRIEFRNFLKRHRDDLEEGELDREDIKSASADPDEIPASMWRRFATKLPSLKRNNSSFEASELESRKSSRGDRRESGKGDAAKNVGERSESSGRDSNDRESVTGANGRRENSQRDNNRDAVPQRESANRSNSNRDRDSVDDDSQEQSRSKKASSKDGVEKKSWLRLPRWKSDPRLGPDYSDVDAEVRKRDEGFEEPFGKKPGWFAKKNEANTDKASAGDRKSGDEKTGDAKSRKWWPQRNKKNGVDAGDQDGDDRVVLKVPAAGGKADGKTQQAKVKKAVSSWFKKSAKAGDSNNTNEQSDATKKVKKSWNLLPKRGEKSASAKSTDSAAGDKPAKKKWFGALDGLKLKPPKEAAGTAVDKRTVGSGDSSGTRNTSSQSSGSTSSQRPVGPSSSSAMRQDAAKSPLGNFNAASKTNSSSSGYDDEDEDDEDGSRTMSKADRKRMKRQQDGRRSA